MKTVWQFREDGLLIRHLSNTTCFSTDEKSPTPHCLTFLPLSHCLKVYQLLTYVGTNTSPVWMYIFHSVMVNLLFSDQSSHWIKPGKTWKASVFRFKSSKDLLHHNSGEESPGRRVQHLAPLFQGRVAHVDTWLGWMLKSWAERSRDWETESFWLILNNRTTKTGV